MLDKKGLSSKNYEQRVLVVFNELGIGKIALASNRYKEP